MKKLTMIIVALMLTTLLLSACGGQEGADSDPAASSTTGSGGNAGIVELSFANNTVLSSKMAGEKFKEIAEAESDSTLVINLFPDNQLGDDRYAVEATQFGDVDLVVTASSAIASIYHDLYLFDAPYLFDTTKEAYDRLNGEAGKAISDGFESIGLKALCYWSHGFQAMTNNKTAVRTPEDMKGLKLRTLESEAQIATWKSFGANPSPMSFNEVFTALQQGALDGQVSGFLTISGNRFQEVQKYVTLLDAHYTPIILLMNLEKYNSLSDQQRAAIDKAAQESAVYQYEQTEKMIQEDLERFPSEGLEPLQLTVEEKAAFQKCAEDAGVYDLVRESMDHPEFMDAFMD